MRQISKNVSPFSNEARNTYVIEHITDALIKLLHDKSIGDISISELCDLAGIGRASFIEILKVKRIFCADISMKYSRNGRTKRRKRKTDR